MEPGPPSPENPAQTAAVRAVLRQQKNAAREAMPAALHAAHSARIEAALETLLGASPAPTTGRRQSASSNLAEPVWLDAAGGTLGFCWPVRQEFDARPLIERLLARGGRACLPVVVAEAAPLQFRGWTPATPLAPDRYGIPTPVAGDFVVPDVLLIPLVAFDARNFRIGYGGGFFDRTLAALSPRPLAIGVGFELARVGDTLPGPHDIALDLVVTEAGVQRG